MIPQAACCGQIKYQAAFFVCVSLKSGKMVLGVVSEKHSWGYKRLENLSLGLSAMRDRQNVLPPFSLGKEKALLIITTPRPLESIKKDLSFALTAEVVACVGFMHQITPSPLYPRLLLQFFMRLLKLYLGASRVVLVVKSPLAIRKNWVQSLGQEDPLEEEMATHSSIIAWRIPWTECCELQPMGSQRVGQD